MAVPEEVMGSTLITIGAVVSDGFGVGGAAVVLAYVVVAGGD